MNSTVRILGTSSAHPQNSADVLAAANILSNVQLKHSLIYYHLHSSGTNYNSINQQRVLYTLAIHRYRKPLQTSTVCLTYLTLYKQTRYMAIKLTKISCIMIIIHYHREIIQREIKYDNFISRCKVKF